MMVDEKLDMSQQCMLTAQKSNHIMGCTKRRRVSRSREVILLLYTLFLGDLTWSTPSSSEFPVQGHGLVIVNPEEGHEDDQSAGAPVLEDRLRQLRLFSLEKRRLQGDLRAAFQYLKGVYKGD
ncbi:hypothetical protein WISP_36344 [Willisornis vidua]|uniref:Uncharacterized protein n=1 Tax=Willisornis vidua TaxID=1566151 RepID=A0ABQ9DP62_9PASS|nr:hypothetical protein WISP_36344 [Willisornis vidua]